MKKTLLFVSALFFIIAVQAQPKADDNLLCSIKFDGNIVLKKAYNNTVSSIAAYCFVDDNTLAILNTEEGRIITYSLSDETIVNKISLPEGYSAMDFDYYSNKFHLLDYDKVYVINNSGSIVQEIEYTIPEGLPFALENFKVIEGKNILNISDGTTWELSADELKEIDNYYWYYENGFKGRTELVDFESSTSFKLSIKSPTNKVYEEKVEINSLGLNDILATVRIMSIYENQVALDIETVTNNENDDPKRFMVFTDFKGKLISKTEIPFIYSTYIQNPFIPFQNGVTYALSDLEGLFFYKLDPTTDQINLPPSSLKSSRPTRIHFNDYLEEARDEEGVDLINNAEGVLKAGGNYVTRTQVIKNSYKFRDLKWTAKAANIQASCATIDGGRVLTPGWITVGAKTAVPYQWGGFTDFDKFVGLVAGGAKTGNRNTGSACSGTAHAWPSTKIIGVDCSGFSSRCWEMSSKQSTRTIPNVCTNMGVATTAANFKKMLPGDVVNKPASHVRVCLSSNPSGTAVFIEAVGSSWKVQSSSQTPSAQSGYYCLRYNHITNARLTVSQSTTVSPATVNQGGPLTATYKVGNLGTESWTGSLRLYLIQSNGSEVALQTQGPITIGAGKSSPTYTYTSSSVNNPTGTSYLVVRAVNSTGGNYKRYYDIEAGGFSNPRSFTIQTGPTNFTIKTSSSPAAGGATTGGKVYANNSSCTVKATANSGYTFKNWTEGSTSVSTNASYTFTVSKDRTLVANFTATDVTAPKLLTYAPASAAIIKDDLRPIIRLVYDEEVKTIPTNAVTLKQVSTGATVSGTIKNQVIKGRSIIHFFPTANLVRGATYRVDISAGLADTSGNKTTAFNFSFSLSKFPSMSVKNIDTFNKALNFDHWYKPNRSGSTEGVVAEDTDTDFDNAFANLSLGSAGSMRLDYAWDTNADPRYIRIHTPEGTPQKAVKFNKENLLQMHVFGDGSLTEIRFVIRDGGKKYEASPWYSINWMGWKLISWDMSKDPAYGWLTGDGVLDGSGFDIDGIHLRHVTKGAKTGTIYIDQLRVIDIGGEDPTPGSTPTLIDSSPSSSYPVSESRPVIRLVYDKTLTTVPTNAVTLKNSSGGAAVPGQMKHQIINGKSVIHFFPTADLSNGSEYTVSVAAGLAGSDGKKTTAFDFSFETDNVTTSSVAYIDRFNTAINFDHWYKPHRSLQTVGTIPANTDTDFDNAFANLSQTSAGSLRLNYEWNTGEAAPYIRLHTPAGSPQKAVKFNKDKLLQMHVFGDGSETEIRFMIRDGGQKYEASPWYVIDWIGWKLVSWDLTNDPAYGWLTGDGVLDGSGFDIDGIHLRYMTGGAKSGTIYIDQLKVIAQENGDTDPANPDPIDPSLAPKLLDYSPSESSPVSEVRPVIRLVYNKELTNASVPTNAVVLKLVSSGATVAGQLKHQVVNGKSVIHFFPTTDLKNNSTYKVDITAGFSDSDANKTTAFTFSFNTGNPQVGPIKIIDAFDSAISGWWQPAESGSTVGVVAQINSNNSFANLSAGSTGSLSVSYTWDTTADTRYLRIHTPANSSPRATKFKKEDLLQMYVFGDGSDTEMRFMINDGNKTYEGSPWYSINWIGWKLVSWDMTNDPAHGWGWPGGDDILDGTDFDMEGIHFQHIEEGAKTGVIYLDQLRILTPLTVTVPEFAKKAKVVLYPNPVRNDLTIEADELVQSVKIYSVSGQLMMNESLGALKTTINMNSLPEGIYIVGVTTESGVNRSKIQVIK